MQFRPGHDDQTPGFSTFMANDPKADITIVIGANLAASPVDGANAATLIYKTVHAVFYPTPDGWQISGVGDGFPP